jgi:hypothetical protein
MSLFSVPALIRHAAAALAGPRGAVADQARRDGCSRQTVYHHVARVEAAVAAAGRLDGDKDREIARLRGELANLRARPAGWVPLDEPRRRRLAAEAAAMGLSVGQIEALFRVLLADPPADAAPVNRPLRAAVHRAWISGTTTGNSGPSRRAWTRAGGTRSPGT